MELKKFDAVDSLDNDEVMFEYQNAALQENDPGYFARALGNVARAKGMSSISRLPDWEGNPYTVLFPQMGTLASTLSSGSWHT